MTDKHKTPEELALNSFLASKTPIERLHITLEEWESYVKGFFAGYEAARQQTYETAYQIGYDIGYKEGLDDLENEIDRPKWISVKERLPEKQDKYLVWCDVGCISPSFTHLTANWFATESGGKWEVDNEGVDGRDYDLLKIIVTHWQPLPEPPKDL